MYKKGFLALFVVYLAKSVVYLAICRLFNFFRLFVVYLAILVVFRALKKSF